MTAALITGLAGTDLSEDERCFYRDVQPAGVIVFRRNVADANQLRGLIGAVRDAVGRDDFLVLVDQEGGRVQRLKPPLARLLPSGAAYARLYEHDAARGCDAAFHVARLCADELASYGINMNCAPVADLPVEGAHDIIGDRAFGRNVRQVVDIARQIANGLMAGGVVPVVKHIPGHGRAMADSHLALPVVETSRQDLSATDFAPFKALHDLPAAMSAHVVYTAVDASAPASTSATVIGDVIRGEIGFDGLLMSDDLSMRALRGPLRDRASAVIRAGSDLALHCNGDMDEMREAATGVPQLSGRAADRFAAACAIAGRTKAFDEQQALAFLDEMMGNAALIA